MHKIFLKLIILSLFFCFFEAKTQEYVASNYTKELNIKFKTDDIKKIEKGTNLLNSALALQNRAENMYAVLPELDKKEAVSEEYNNSLKLLSEASEMYRNGHKIIYDVFKELSNEFWLKMKKVQHYAEGVEKGRYYEGQARKNMQSAELRRNNVLAGNRFDFLQRQMKEANELEEKYIMEQGRALQVYKDYPVEYNYGWENDITLEELNEIYKNPSIKEPPVDIYATIDTTINVESTLKEEIIFKVQIAAHTVPITEEYLRMVYKGTIPIDMIYEDEWYKYSIGRYKTYEEAFATLQTSNVRKAFIVAYQGGKKVVLNQAVENLP